CTEIVVPSRLRGAREFILIDNTTVLNKTEYEKDSQWWWMDEMVEEILCGWMWW
ncbi:hypothetical protein A2U01_0026212, partial [Trifolium medium]|nr:hypothetical protein [Trifolium medium]